MSVPCSRFGTACQGLKGSVPAFTIMIHGQKNCLGPKLPCFLVVHIYMKICPEIKISAIFWSYLLLSGQHSPLPADPQRDSLGYLPVAHLFPVNSKYWGYFLLQNSQFHGGPRCWNRYFAIYGQNWERELELMLPEFPEAGVCWRHCQLWGPLATQHKQLFAHGVYNQEFHEEFN